MVLSALINNYLTYFAGDDVAEVFCADNTFDIKDMDRGMILLLAMPQKLQTERRYVCTLLKLLFYQHVSDRFDLKSDSDAWINKNVLILWQDEAQSFASEADKVVDKIREAMERRSWPLNRCFLFSRRWEEREGRGGAAESSQPCSISGSR